jgi:hypothetical protein
MVKCGWNLLRAVLRNSINILPERLRKIPTYFSQKLYDRQILVKLYSMKAHENLEHSFRE